jgi:cullin 3
MALFRENILYAPLFDSYPDETILQSLFTIILEHIQLERQGDIVDNLLIRSCVYMLEGIYETELEDEMDKIYLTKFEPLYLRTSREHYNAEGVGMLRSMDAGTYFRTVDDILRKEADRCKKTICATTARKIEDVIEDELLTAHFKEVLAMAGSGGQWMLDNDRFDDMQLAYDLNLRIDPTKIELVAVLQRRIIELGRNINESIRNWKPSEEEAKTNMAGQQTIMAIKWVEAILVLIEKFDLFWTKSFRSDKGIQAALNKSYENVINDLVRCPEFISLFLDENLKRGIKGKTEAEVDHVLEKAIILIRFVRDKDLFERYYKKHLARRLLLSRSASEDVERQMISRMKVEVGNSFTQKLEGMFRDMSVSAELTDQFHRSMDLLDASERLSFSLNINVLTSTFWPEELTTTKPDEAPCIFPKSIERAKEKFVRFYDSKHSGRKLFWKPGRGSADVIAHFPANGNLKERRYELNVSTYGMMLLTLFNDSKTLSFLEIEQMTQISRDELFRNLQSLSVPPKTRVLLKEPMSRDVKPTDRFTFNESFVSKMIKIKVGVVAGSSKVEGEEERSRTQEKNDEQRCGIIEAAIVRIMKYVSLVSYLNLTDLV